ncbi:MAG: PQQ-binding-like beta-propeller repeat protein [Polyangiales bacterium]
MKRRWLCVSSLVVACTSSVTGSGDAGVVDVQRADVPVEDVLSVRRAPLDRRSPWPKFRGNIEQDGRVEVTPFDDGSAPWVFQTGKGVFSTPVVDGDGVVYVGSADRNFYAIGPDGRERWRLRTGEIIDSSALLDDMSRVYVGSGDGYLYALNRRDGTMAWRFQADDPATNNAFIRWFEGNVGMTEDGTLIAPNDNFCTYAVNRLDGTRRWCFRTNDQTWSLPAYDIGRQLLLLGNNYLLGNNVFGINAGDGSRAWSAAIPATVAASPMYLDRGPEGTMVVGGFDGYVRAFAAFSGTPLWSRGLRDHIYASPARLSDGTIIQPAADGTVWALNPTDGSVRWTFDALEPIRSSPAVDARDQIYVGSGEGRLFVLNANGTLRWSMRLIADDRDDLNASVALGRRGAVVAGENGGVFFVPFDYCLRPAAAMDARCRRGPGEDLPADGAFLYRTTRFGRPLPERTATIDANEPLAFSLFVRRGGDTQLAFLDDETLEVTATPPVPLRVERSGDRRFFTVTPEAAFTPDAQGHVMLRVRGRALQDPMRDGLRFTGGSPGASLDVTWDLTVRPALRDPLTLRFPAQPGDPTPSWELARIAAPLPTILPSYNQIGFDSIHYLLGAVEGDAGRAVLWGVGAAPTGTNGAVEVDPTSSVRFPMIARWEQGRFTIANEQPFFIDFNGFQLPFETFRVSTRTDAAGTPLESPALVARANCGRIDFYGAFLRRLGFCNPTSDTLLAFGAADLRLHAGGALPAPAGLGTPQLSATSTEVRAELTGATLRAAAHNFGLLVLDADGRPLSLDYVRQTRTVAASDGRAERVTLTAMPPLSGRVRVYLMVDAYPAARATITL